MDDLRNEIRAAFEKEQAMFPPTGDLRPSLVRSAVTHDRRPSQPNVQWMAVAAAVVIAVLVVVGLMSSRLTNRGTVSPPKVSPSPSPVSDYGPPPAGVPLFYVADGNHPGWYIGFDWSGTPRGTIKLPSPVDSAQSLLAAPDGSGFVVAPFKGLGGEYFDRLGRPIAPANSSGARLAWADDSKHVCALNFTGGQNGRWEIDLLAPDGTSTSSHPVALDPSIVRSGIIAIDFRSCSPAHDRAVLAYNYFGVPTEVYVVRISDGKILLQQNHSANLLVDVTASPDGSLIAENSSRSSGYIAGPTAPNTVIRRSSDGSVVKDLDPTYGVLAFSADDSVALVNTSPWASGVATHLALIKVDGGDVVWRYDGGEEYGGALVQPGGSSIAVILTSPSDQSGHPSVDLLVVRADGSSTTIPGKYVRP